MHGRCAVCDAVYDASAAPIRCPSCEALVPPHPKSSPFARLGLEPAAAISDADVDNAWLRRSRLVHPDRFASKSPAERRAAAEQTVAMNDALRALKTRFDRASWCVAQAGVSEPRLPQARLVAFMEAREDAEASADARARVVDDAVREFADHNAALDAVVGELNWVSPEKTPAPVLRKVAGILAELRTTARLSADLGGPVLLPSIDRR